MTASFIAKCDEKFIESSSELDAQALLNLRSYSKLVKMLMRCPADPCGRPFQINRFNAEFLSAQERGKIVCPHCGTVVWQDNDAIFLTHALSNEQEMHFLQENTRGGAQHNDQVTRA